MNLHHQSASLYIGDLDPPVTEAQLFEIFKAVGPVASIRVCRDAITRASLGYAYVNFHNVADAERALDTLNYTPIKGRPCRIMWCHRDPSVRKSGKGNIFIKNLHPDIDNKALYDTFSAFGNILSCKVVNDENSVSKGYGFVHYETQEAAEEAIDKVNGMSLYDKIVYVGPFIARKERLEKFTNIYVKHFSPSLSDDDLKQEFSKFGEIQNAVIMRDEKGTSRGFAFINFTDHESAKKAVDEMNGRKLFDDEDAKPLYVSRAQKKAERDAQLKSDKAERANKYQGLNLYIKNLDESISDEKLREIFTPFGEITSAKVMRDEKGNSKGFGFVCFSSPEEASKAVTEMSSTLIQNKPIYVALAETREVRKAKLDAHRSAMIAGRGVPTGPIYPGAPVFYPTAPPGATSRGAGFVYPPANVRGGVVPPGPASRWAAPPGGAGFRGIPHGYIVNPSAAAAAARGAGARPNGRGRGSSGGRAPSSRGGTGRGGNLSPGAVRGYKGYPPRIGMLEGAGRISLTTALAQTPREEERKMIIGEHLFPLIQAEQPIEAAKITGMFLESMDVGELLQAIDSPEFLSAKIEEALTVLKGTVGGDDETDEALISGVSDETGTNGASIDVVS